MARIKVIDYPQAEGRLRDIYDYLIEKRGHLAEVHKIQSLRPESIVKHMDLYMEIMFSRSSLSRAEREMMAVVVSAVNGCTYCQAHHGEALNRYWQDKNKVKALRRNFGPVFVPTDGKKGGKKDFLSLQEQRLCEFARSLTINPGAHENKDYTIILRDAGIEEAGILDAVLVIAYFNFVNRIVLSLGIALEESGGEGYDY